MSLAALAQAVRDRLQAVILMNGESTDANTCECTFTGKPKPIMGQLFLAVHILGWQGISGDNDLHESAQIGVTVTLRLGFAPEDRDGIAVWLAANTGLEPITRAVVKAIHKDYANVMNLANTKYIGTGSAGFVTPLWFLGGGNPTFQQASWFGAVPDPEDPNSTPCGVSMELRFGKAERCQALDNTET